MRVWIFVAALIATACSSSANEPATSAPSQAVEQEKHLPCEVSAILQRKCWQCHGHPTQETAPMSLTTWEELHAPALKKVGPPAPVFQRIALRIHDRTSPMPPRNKPQLTASELRLLDSWLGLGAPSGQACPRSDDARAESSDAGSDASPSQDERVDASMRPGNEAPSRSSSSSSSGEKPTTPKVPSADGGTMPQEPTNPERPTDLPPVAPEDTPVPPDDSECDFVELRARQDGSGAPYRVPADVTDEYLCFVFDLAFDKPTHALAIYPLIDNKRVLHHWLLHVTNEVDASQNVTSCNTSSPNIRLLAGGSSYGGDWYLPKHVGLDIGTGKFILEVHYNNIGGSATEDRSGAKICTTQNLRPETAVVSWLGNQLFAIPPHVTNYEVAGRCKPEITKPIHLLRSWPHMHRLGVRMTMQHDRADGSNAMIFDVPFAFESQTNVDANVVLKPGDSLVTKCFFDNPTDFVVGIGERASDEMCNNFVVAYPAGALVSNWPSVSNDACLGPL